MSKLFIKTASAVAWADAKRGMPIANIKANVVCLLNTHKGWCLYHEHICCKEIGAWETTFVGICSGSLLSGNFKIHRKYFGEPFKQPNVPIAPRPHNG